MSVLRAKEEELSFDGNNKKDEVLAEAIRLLAAVILVLGLVAAGFYAKSHHIDDEWFFIGAVVVFIAGVSDRIF